MKVSRGSTRIVVLVGRWAIKFPSTYSYRHFLQGLLANEQETAWYKAFASSNKLCPVLFTFPGCLFIVMPRAKILTRHEFLDLQHTIDYFRWFVLRMRARSPQNSSMTALDGSILSWSQLITDHKTTCRMLDELTNPENSPKIKVEYAKHPITIQIDGHCLRPSNRLL